MASSPWIDLSYRFNDIALEEYYRPYAAIQDLSFPEQQDLQLIAFIGDRVKSRSLRNLFSTGNIPGHSKIYLQLLPGYTDSQSPIFIADCELHNISSLSKVRSKERGVVKEHVIRWHRDVPRLDPHTLANLVYSKLIIPFCNILCFFADDFGGTATLAKVLASWLITLSNRSPDLPIRTYPRILILQRWKDPGETFDEKLATDSFKEEIRYEIDCRNASLTQIARGKMSNSQFSQLLKQQFGDIAILPLPLQSNDTGRVQCQFQKLRKRILQESKDIQALRNSAWVAFSAHHFKAFFHTACDHFATDIVAPFSFVKASRLSNQVPLDFSSHINSFLKLSPEEHRMTFSVPIIASALCLDSYPPHMHRFDPELVFKRIYDKILYQLEIWPEQPELKSQVLMKIQSLFCQQILRATEDTALIHKRLLPSFAPIWQEIHSNTTCFSCLARKPENTLTCGHSFCDPCVVIHSRTHLEEPWKFAPDICPLCKAPNKTAFQLKPYTAGVRCLVIDGADAQDFRILNDIENSLNIRIPLCEQFDLVNGSGLGSLQVLETFCKEIEPTATLKQPQLLEERFSEAPNSKVSRFSYLSTSESGDEDGGIWSELNGVLKIPFAALPRWRDSMNANSIFKSNLKSSLGSEKTVFECGARVKVAITVLRFKDSMPCIFSNYNGSDTRPSTYHLIRPKKQKEEVLLWHAGCAAVSQKTFRGYYARESSVYQELIEITLSEQNNIWSRAGKSPDALVCLGTRVPAYERPQENNLHWLFDYRLNGANAPKSLETVETLLASQFYLELIGPPQIIDVGFFCRASIKCRILPSSTIYCKMIEQLRKRRARFYYDYKSIPCVNRQLYDEAARGIAFSRYIEFSIVSLSDEIDIKISGITEQARSISNCPYKVQTLVEDQGLSCVFGHRDHRRRYFGSCGGISNSQWYI